MCLIVVSWKQYENHPLILLGNRDEFYRRPTAPAHYWDVNPNILAGKDLEAGGTWLGMTKNGKFTAITNYRDFSSIRDNAPSRGALTTNYLQSNLGPQAYLESIKSDIDKYNGFNLMVGTPDELWYINNINHRIMKLSAGIYGLSNAVLDTPWPKVEKAKDRLIRSLRKGKTSESDLLPLLYDQSLAEDNALPQTGAGLELERKLSAMFIKTEKYGTGITSLLKLDREGRLHFTEQTHAIGSKDAVIKQFSIKLLAN